MAQIARTTSLNTHGFLLNLFPPNLDAKYLCSKCNLAVCDPVQCYCGHRFCSVCLVEITSHGLPVTCASCLKENSVNEHSIVTASRTFPDNALKKEMMSLPVTCTNEGCTWKGTLKQYSSDHMTSCSFRSVRCECGMSVPESSLSAHKNSVCPGSTRICSYCSDSITDSSEQEHYDVCLKYPSTCSSCSKTNIPRDAMISHIMECSRRMNKCPFGCQDVSAQELQQHMSENKDKHIELVGLRLVEISSILRSLNAPESASNSNLQSKIEDINHRLESVERNRTTNAGVASNVGDTTMKEMFLKVTTFEGIATVLKDEQERCINLIEQCQVQRNSDNRRLEPLELKVASLEQEVKQRDTKIAELEARLAIVELVSYDSQLIWKIPEFSRIRREAIGSSLTSIYSPPFYTNRTGYKMCTRLYPNGDGMGKDKYVSLFFAVMRGPYDALLPWPFRQKVTFMLLDQSGKEHILDAFRPDPGSSSFRRPVSEMNIASGCPMFVKLEDLDRMANNYLKDDVMFIKVIVAPLDT